MEWNASAESVAEKSAECVHGVAHSCYDLHGKVDQGAAFVLRNERGSRARGRVGFSESALTDRCSPGFDRLLEPFSLHEIERHQGSVFGLWSDFRLAYFNPGCVRFARDNGGDPRITLAGYLGTSVLDVTPEVLRPFYRSIYQSCLHRDHRRPRPIHHRYECSSPALLRDFVMTLYRLEGGGDWVPEWVERSSPEVSHALCQFCVRYYYLECGDENAIAAIDSYATR